jgi:hypothetical protein
MLIQRIAGCADAFGASARKSEPGFIGTLNAIADGKSITSVDEKSSFHPHLGDFDFRLGAVRSRITAA